MTVIGITKIEKGNFILKIVFIITSLITPLMTIFPPSSPIVMPWAVPQIILRAHTTMA